jgi:hypothetical protein
MLHAQSGLLVSLPHEANARPEFDQPRVLTKIENVASGGEFTLNGCLLAVY